MTALARVRRAFAERPWLAFVLLHTVQALAVFWIAAQARFCCDASHYLYGGRALLHDGLLWADPHAGYRFFFTPLVMGALQNLIGVFVTPDRVASFIPYLLAALFVVSSASCSLFVLRRYGLARWTRLAVPIFLNPLVLSIVPYPLQESVVCIFAVPLLFVLLALDAREFTRSCVIGALLIGFTLIARPSLVWITIPVCVLLITRARRAASTGVQVARGVAIAMGVLLLMYSPQAYVNWNKWQTFAPIANTKVADDQLAFGIDMLNFGTIYDDTKFGGERASSPYTSLPRTEKNLAFYSTHPKAGLFLALTHAWSSLHFVAFVPYMPRSALDVFTLPLLMSSVTVAFGLIGLFGRSRPYDETSTFLLLTVLLSCTYCALVATENRFGLFGFIAIAVAAWQVPIDADTRTLALRASPLVLVYVCLCVMINALLMYRTGVLWPQPA
jgi:hypothetical protein